MKNKIFTNNSKYIYGDEGRNSLEKLLKPFDFLTYPEDGIKDVKITLMRLRPFNGDCDITFTLPKSGQRHLYEIVGSKIDYDNFDSSNLLVKEVELNIDFELTRYQTSLVNIKSCGQYQLVKSNSEVDYILVKYLKYWQLI